MFEKSYFETLQDYIASGCTIELTGDELDYYNALYALAVSYTHLTLPTNREV